MLEIIIKTILIVFSVFLMLGVCKDIKENNLKNCFGYMLWVFIELIVIVVML